MDINTLYKKHLPMIKNRARSWARQGIVGLDIEDLESLGDEVFLIAYNEYDETKSKFSTYLWIKLNQQFSIEVNKSNNRYLQQHEEFENAFIGNSTDIEDQYFFLEKLKCLSSDAMFIVNSALNTPIELMELAKKETGKYCINKKRIQRYLIENKGWGIGKCWNCFKEIREALTD